MNYYDELTADRNFIDSDYEAECQRVLRVYTLMDEYNITEYEAEKRLEFEKYA